MTEANNTGLALSSRGATYKGILEAAIDLFEAGNVDESERRCRLLLSYPDLGDWHAANCHLILSYGQDNFVKHAEQAVDLFENLYTVRSGGSWDQYSQPSEASLRTQQRMLNAARASLDRARQDETDLRADFNRKMEDYKAYHGNYPSDEQLVQAHWKRHFKGTIEHLEKNDAEMDEYMHGRSEAEPVTFDGYEDDNTSEIAKDDQPEPAAGDQTPSASASGEGNLSTEDDDDLDFPYLPLSPPESQVQQGSLSQDTQLPERIPGDWNDTSDGPVQTGSDDYNTPVQSSQ